MALAVVAVAALAGCGMRKVQWEQPVADSPTGATRAAAPRSPSVSGTAGVAALSADQIVRQAKAALARAKSFRVKGALDMGGSRTKVDFRIREPDFAATISTGKVSLDLLAVGGERYLHGNEQFWISTAGEQRAKIVASVFGDRWIAGTESAAELFDLGTVDALLKPRGTWVKAAPKKIGSAPAIGLKDSKSTATVLYIATAGQPYPLRMIGKNGSAVVFGDFGKNFTEIRTPPANRVADLRKLPGA